MRPEDRLPHGITLRRVYEHLQGCVQTLLKMQSLVPRSIVLRAVQLGELLRVQHIWAGTPSRAHRSTGSCSTAALSRAHPRVAPTHTVSDAFPARPHPPHHHHHHHHHVHTAARHAHVRSAVLQTGSGALMEVYRTKVAAGEIVHDEAQQQTLAALDVLVRDMETAKRNSSHRGLYIYGGVGTAHMPLYQVPVTAACPVPLLYVPDARLVQHQGVDPLYHAV